MLNLSISEIYAVVIVALVMGAALLWIVPGLLRQIFCKHPQYREQPANHATCTRCRKNLGAVALLRGQRPLDELTGYDND